jgi:hypothetical protein
MGLVAAEKKPTEKYLLQESFCSRRGHLKGDDGCVQPLSAKKTKNFFWEMRNFSGDFR